MGGLIAPVAAGALGAGVGSFISPQASAGLGLSGAGAGLGLSSAYGVMNANRNLVNSMAGQEALLGQSNAAALANLQQQAVASAQQTQGNFDTSMAALSQLGGTYAGSAGRTIGKHLSTLLGSIPNVATGPNGVTTPANTARERLVGGY